MVVRVRRGWRWVRREAGHAVQGHYEGGACAATVRYIVSRRYRYSRRSGRA